MTAEAIPFVKRNTDRGTATDTVPFRRVRVWLEEVRSAAGAIDRLRREVAALEQAQSEVVPWSTGGGSSSKTAHADPTAGAAIARTVALKSSLEDARAALARAEATILAFWSAMGALRSALGEEHAEVLKLYYLNRAPTWSAVAREIGVPASTVRYRRDRAMEWLESVCAETISRSRDRDLKSCAKSD